MCFSIFLDPIQNRALSRSVQLEAVYLEALLYKSKPGEHPEKIWVHCYPKKISGDTLEKFELFLQGIFKITSQGAH